MNTSIHFSLKNNYLLDEGLNWATPEPGTWASAVGGKRTFSPGNRD